MVKSNKFPWVFPSMARNFHVLSFGYDRSLMATRSLLLRDSGYVVQEAFSRQQALAQASSDLVDVLLICHTVPENESKALVSAVRKQRLMIPILCIGETDYSDPFKEGCTVIASTPQELLAAVHSAAKEAPGPRLNLG